MPTVCQGSNGVTYTVADITGATSYNWTIPTGATIASGANTSSITVDFSLAATSGNVTVSGVNLCGTGTSSNMVVTVNIKPATPAITQNLNILSSDAPAGNQWYRDGVVIQGAVGQTYEVTEDGTYTVIVTLNDCSSDVSNSIVILHTGIENLDAQVLNVYPNPSDGTFWLSVNSQVNSLFDMEVLNNTGTCVFKQNNLQVNGIFKQHFDLSHLAAGMYTIVLRSDSKQMVQKIIIKK
jgi:hypothetical protein